MIQVGPRHIRFTVAIVSFFLFVTNSFLASSNSSEKFSGTVIFIRHALAPGNGDPDNFKINDCLTQRNLNSTGRTQARAIGAKLAKARVKAYAIYSSYWCRCLETASLLNLGPVIPFDGLNSFYEDHSPREATLSRLVQKLSTLPRNEAPIIMVTHYVTIAAITGLLVNSGGIVVYNLETSIAHELAFSSLD